MSQVVVGQRVRALFNGSTQEATVVAVWKTSVKVRDVAEIFHGKVLRYEPGSFSTWPIKRLDLDAKCLEVR